MRPLHNKDHSDYNTAVFKTLMVLLLVPAWSFAACGNHRLQYYDLLLRENRMNDALGQVLHDLEATRAETRAFNIRPVDEKNSAQTLAIPPAVLQTGKSAACQYVAGTLAHFHSRERDRERLITYHRDWIAAKSEWGGCDVAGHRLDDPAEAANTAFQCLEDPSLESHQAAIEIRALLAKARAGDVPRLSDDDSDVLQQQLNLFQDGAPVLEDKATNSYYLPAIKRDDRKVFCAGVRYTRLTLKLKNEETSSWQRICDQLEDSAE